MVFGPEPPAQHEPKVQLPKLVVPDQRHQRPIYHAILKRQQRLGDKSSHLRALGRVHRVRDDREAGNLRERPQKRRGGRKVT